MADAVNGREQQIVRSRRPAARRWPQLLEQPEDPRMPGRQPQRTRQAELAQARRQRQRRAAAAHEFGDFFGRAEVALMHDAWPAVDAGAFDDVVVELVGFLLGDERSHIG